MDIDDLRRYCLRFPHATENVQWGADLCFKVDGKMFAVAALEVAPVRLSFKCSPENFAELCERSRDHSGALHGAGAMGGAASRSTRFPTTSCATCLLNRTGWCGSGCRRSVGMSWRARPRPSERRDFAQRRKRLRRRRRRRRRPQRAAASEARSSGVVVAGPVMGALAERRSCARLQPEQAAPDDKAATPDSRQSWNSRCLPSFARETPCDFWAYVPEDGVNLGRDAVHTTRAEIEEQLTHHTGLYCKLFDSSCLPPPGKARCDAADLLVPRVADAIGEGADGLDRNNAQQCAAGDPRGRSAECEVRRTLADRLHLQLSPATGGSCSRSRSSYSDNVRVEQRGKRWPREIESPQGL